MSGQTTVLWGGLVLGLVFGVLAQRTAFCLAGGLREWWLEGRVRRAAGFGLALAVALAATQLLAAAGLIDLTRSLYLQPGFSWLLVPLGGVLFGYGMMLACGCGARALVLLGAGNLRSLVVLLCLGIAAHATLGGVLAPLRVLLADATTITPSATAPGLGNWLADSGWPLPLAALFPGLLIALALAVVALRASSLHRSPGHLAGVVGIGALIGAGWWLTGWLAADDFEPVPLQSFSFVAPVGDAIQYLMLATGMRVDFGIGIVGGVLAGAFVAALAGAQLKLKGFESTGQLLRAMGGGALMGTGGVLALGCSIGQGLSGLSTLAFVSMLAVAGIFIGAALALRGPLRLHQLHHLHRGNSDRWTGEPS